MIEVTTLIYSILGFSAFNLVLGYILGHYGLSTIESDVSEIKDMLSGKAKVTVAETPAVVTPTVVA